MNLVDRTPNQTLTRLEDLPNIGKAIAADLRSLGVDTPAQLAELDPLTTFECLATIMGTRHDPCVLYTLMAVSHFQKSGEVQPWWRFTAQPCQRHHCTGQHAQRSQHNQRLLPVFEPTPAQ
jgi:DNA transformation protein